jgi:hypothetical protein
MMQRAPADKPRIITEVGERREAFRRLIRRLTIGGAVAVAVALAAWQIVMAVTSPDSCGTGMVIQGTECIGVTDGSPGFDPSLAMVESKITAENGTMQSAGDFVSVALLTPLTTDPGSDVTLARIRAELEGAYTAQQYLNGQGFRPRIRLLLANEGGQEQAWRQVVRDLQSEIASQHLVAVIGVGLSTIPTLQTAKALAAGPDPLPMIGTVDTADGLNSKGPPASLVGSALSGPIQDLTRVEPSTGDEVALLRAYLTNHSPRLLRHVMLVYDTNSQDLYTATLGDGFRSQFAANLIGTERYVGTPGTTAIANEFNAIAGEVCPPGTANPPTILYAGRQSLLPTLIDQLRGLSMCLRRTITIVTGADAEALPASATSPNPAGPQISVVYPNLVDPALLTTAYKDAFTGLFGTADLDASWGIMTYDGVIAAEQAARAVVGGSATVLPTPAELGSALFDFNMPTHALDGAAGNFLISSDGDEQCQGLPIIIYRNGTATTIPPSPQPGCP